MFIYIYKLIKKGAINDDMVYIGSTTDVKTRMYNHKGMCHNPESPKYNYKVYKYIRENGGFDEWEMIIIDKIEVPLIICEQRDKCENEYIRRYDAINKLNICYSSRTKKEYYLDNREIILEKKKVYRENNREIIAEKKKQKVCCNICGLFVSKDYLCKHRQTQKCINYKNLSIK